MEKKIGFHEPEMLFPLARMFLNYVSTRKVKNITGRDVWKIKAFPLARTSPSTKRNVFKNMFSPDGKIKLAVAGVSQNGRKKMVSTGQKMSSH